MANTSDYHDQYCAFVDILGFRGLVASLSDGATPFESLRALLTKVHSSPSIPHLKDEYAVKTQSISDAVALSANVNSGGLAVLFHALQSLAVDLLCEGYFVRGAIVKGKLYHDEHMVFGEALVRAYYFESEVAKYPRIMVTREVADDLIHYRGKCPPNALRPDMDALCVGNDGPRYLNILQPIAALGRKKAHPYEKLNGAETLEFRRYARIRDRIQIRFEEAVDNPRHFEKVQWFARYWNDVVARGTDFGRILGPGLDDGWPTR